MNIFVAGGTGTIGVPLVRALLAAGHEVHALTRSPNKADEIRTLGAHPAVADALDADALAPRRARGAADACHSSADRAAERRSAPRERSRPDQSAEDRRDREI